MLSKSKLRKVSYIKELFTEEVLSILKKNENEKYSICLDESQIYTFREKVSSIFESSTSIKKSKIEDEFFYQDDIKFLLKHLKKDEISNKPNLIINGSSKVEDALAPPYEDGQLIEDDFAELGSHRLLFNKFAVMEEHVVLTTRDFFSQNTHLTYEDWVSAMILKKRLDAFVFFNGGKDAGSSQPRKHLQAIPLKSMYNGDFGLFLLLKEQKYLQYVLVEDLIEYDLPFKLYKLTYLEKLQHLIIKFDQDECAVKTYIAYNLALLYLNLLEDQELITKNYSLLIFENYIMIIARESSRIFLKNGHLEINSVGFLFTILLKSEQVADELKKLNIKEEVYSKL
jgi:ATP adenylyltransferase